MLRLDDIFTSGSPHSWHLLSWLNTKILKDNLEGWFDVNADFWTCEPAITFNFDFKSATSYPWIRFSNTKDNFSIPYQLTRKSSVDNVVPRYESFSTWLNRWRISLEDSWSKDGLLCKLNSAILRSSSLFSLYLVIERKPRFKPAQVVSMFHNCLLENRIRPYA